MKQKGLIQVYTGDGKGKTTAAVGMAVRAIGQGLKIIFIQFFKDPKRFGYGETKVLKKLPHCQVFNFAPKHPHFFRVSPEEIKKELNIGMKLIEEIFIKKNCDLLILDEIIIALRDSFLKEEELLKLLKKKPNNMEVILTGRGAPKRLIESADLVSEVKKIKHPYDRGMKGRKGIEF
jgi:cob(I)alamin adenosyltransferase